jgi:hypothetical protein
MFKHRSNDDAEFGGGLEAGQSDILEAKELTHTLGWRFILHECRPVRATNEFTLSFSDSTLRARTSELERSSMHITSSCQPTGLYFR